MLRCMDALATVGTSIGDADLKLKCDSLEDVCTGIAYVHACNALTRFCADIACGARVSRLRSESVSLPKGVCVLLRSFIRACSQQHAEHFRNTDTQQP